MNSNQLSQQYQVGILGTGRIGRSLAQLLRRNQWDVVVGSRLPMRGESVSYATAAAREVVILAIPHTAIEEQLPLLASIGADSVLIDCANAVTQVNGHLASGITQPHPRWLAEQLPNVRISRAFNHIQDELLASRAVRQPHTWAVGIAADDSLARLQTAAVVHGAGYVPVDVGEIAAADVLEPGGPVFPNMYLPADLERIVRDWRQRSN